MSDLQLARALFEHARQLPEADRHAYVTSATGDESLAALVLEMLLQDVAAQTVRDQHRADVPPRGVQSLDQLLGRVAGLLIEQKPGEAVRFPSPPRPGDQLGKYKLREELGVGAFGRIWMAWDVELECYVALKLMPAGGYLGERVEPMLMEARAASGLQHPNVVGVRAAGRFGPPHDWMYIDMQLCADAAPRADDPKAVVLGSALPDRLRGNAAEAARLMVQVCRGVVAAHAQGIVHCDLKPGNVLVTPSGRAMVADFGLSSSDLLMLASTSEPAPAPERSIAVRTQSGRRIQGTPMYMSPEQACAEQPRPVSDVYALGAVMYWLLTGRDPYPRRPDETIHSLLARVADPDDAPAPLDSGIPATLRRICCKAMSKDPRARYQSAAAMEADISAWIERRVPPQVGPDSVAQPLVLGMRRHLGVVVAVVLGVVGVSIALAEVARQHARAVQQREIAELSAAQAFAEASRASAAEAAADQARAQADRSRDIALAVNQFVSRDLLGAFNPWHMEGREPTLREIIEAAAVNLADVDQPEVEAELRQTVGHLFQNLGAADQATEHLTRSVELREQIHGPESIPVAEALHELAWAIGNRADRRQSSQAAEIARRAARIYESLAGENDPRTLRATVDVSMFEAFARGDGIGDLDTVTLVAIAAARGKGESPRQLRRFLEGLNLEIILLWREGHRERAIRRVVEEAEPVVRAPLLGDNVGIAMAGYALRLLGQGSRDAAECLAHAAIRTAAMRHGEDHPHTLWCRAKLAEIYFGTERPAAAIALLEELLPRAPQFGVESHREFLYSKRVLALAYWQEGKRDLAAATLETALEISRQAYGIDDELTLSFLIDLGRTLLRSERRSEVLALLQPAESIARSIFRKGLHTGLPAFLDALGAAHGFEGNFQRAEALLLEAHDLWKAIPEGADSPGSAVWLRDLYRAWHAAEPGRGFDGRAQEWAAMLDAEAD